MRKALLIPVIALVLVSTAGLVMFSYEDGFGGGSGGAGRGFGAQGAAGAQSSGLGSVWLVVFAVPLAVALVAVGYMVAFPEIKTAKPKKDAAEAKQSQTLDAVLRVLNEDEKKVVQALAEAKEGTMLQKDIRWKTGMTRVKTHRVLARLAARGIVSAEKHYNTNKITLTNWITTNTKNNKQAITNN